MAIFDYRQDTPLDAPAATAPENAILLCDGVFLLRPELMDDWDYSIFVAVDFDVSVARALARDLTDKAGPDEIQALRQLYARRYVPGQKIYLRQVRPVEKATVILMNNDCEFPSLGARA